MTEPIVDAGHAQLVEFARWVIRESAFAGCDLQGDDVQEKAVALGLLREEAYEPDKHSGNYDIAPGDPILLFAGPLA